MVEHLLSNHGTLHSIPNTARGKKLTERKRRGGKEEETREKQEECERLLLGRVNLQVDKGQDVGPRRKPVPRILVLANEVEVEC